MLESSQQLKTSVFSNLIWKFMERCCAQLVSFIVATVLARILLPEDYGVIAMINVFITIADVFVTSGLGVSLIQKKDADHLDFSSMFYFSIVYAIILYSIIYLCAPFVGGFYGQVELITILRVMALRLPIAAVNSVQHAYVSRHMMFRKFFFSTLGGTLVSAMVGIILALKGFGAWALVAQYMTNSIVDTLVLFCTLTWKPKWEFSFKRVKILYGFGWKIMISSVLHTVYTQFRQLLVGKIYTSTDLAYMEKGEHFPAIIVNNINASLDSVLFPAMSRCQTDRERLKQVVRHSIKTSSFLMWPLMIGLAVVAEPLVRLLLTEKWLFCVIYLRVGCMIQAFMPIHTANLQAIKALGRSDISLKLEIIKKLVGICLVVFAVPHGVLAVSFSALIQTVIAAILNTYPNRKLLDYTYHEQIADLLPSFFISLVMGGVVYCLNYISCTDLIKLVLQIITGGIVYVILSWLTKNESFHFLLNIVKEYIIKYKRK